ncbi:hypothetical protein ABFX02_14G297200 [Erythranthe guttata]
MQILCDVCENAAATVVCCADEAALCAECDVQVHGANKLARKHQRLLLECLSDKLPPCDICQKKVAFVFCVEDRALFCKDCDKLIHSANSLTAKHQRYLATGIRVALSSSCNDESSRVQIEPKPPKSNSTLTYLKIEPQIASGASSPSWAVDEFLQFSDNESPDKKEHLEFSELECLTDANLIGHESTEVPQLSVSLQPSNLDLNKATKLYTAHKRPRIDETLDNDEEHFTVPNLG